MVGYLEPGKQRNAGRNGHVCAVTARVDINSGVIAGIFVLDCRLCTSPVPVLSGAGIKVRQPCPFGGIYFNITLFGGIGCLADVDIMFDGVVYALA